MAMRRLLLLALVWNTTTAATNKNDQLIPLAYEPLALGTVVPQGWIKAQLEAQRFGLCGRTWLGRNGHVSNSAWVGGMGYDDLEEAYPYWLNGAWPMAVLLQDAELMNDIKTGLEIVFSRQDQAMGWLGPFDQDGSKSPWNTFRFCTALTQYIDATGTSSPRAIDSLFAHAAALLSRLRALPLQPGEWSHSRWQELLGAYQWLLDHVAHREVTVTIAQTKTVFELMKLVQSQGFDWPRWVESDECHPFATNAPTSIRDWFPNNTEDADAIGHNRWLPHIDRQWTHGVNLGQAMSTWHLLSRFESSSSEKERTLWLQRGRAAWHKIMTLHGQATGVFSADENLAGTLPNRGTETCAVVELMNSAAVAFQVSGDVFYLDVLERIALNALPAAFFNGTMWSMNYFQQVNKIDAMDGQPQCESSEQCVYCFGMPYECCTSNHAQGWPKFVSRQLQISNSGALAITLYFPSSTTRSITLGNSTIGAIHIATNYPWDERVVVKVQNASSTFNMSLRIPGWCESASLNVNGVNVPETPKAGTLHLVSLHGAGSHRLKLRLPMSIRIERRPPYAISLRNNVTANAVNVVRGPLVYALPVNSVQDHDVPFDDNASCRPRGQSHGQDNYLMRTGEWRYALVLNNDSRPETSFHHETRGFQPLPLGQGPFAASLVPSRILAKAVKLFPEQWDVVHQGRGASVPCAPNTTSIDAYNASWADLPPRSPVTAFLGKVEELVLLPFGATNLRIAEFPTTTMGNSKIESDFYTLYENNS